MDSESDPFLQALGDCHSLPPAVLRLHKREGRYHGRCTIERGSGLFIALALRAGRFPPEGQDIPVSLNIQREGDQWLWERDFAGHKTRSWLSFDRNRDCVREQIGALTIWMRPTPTESGLSLSIERLCVFGIPCPRFLMPQSTSAEGEDGQSRFQFNISASLPGFGLLIRYQGWLTPDHINQGVA